MTVDTKNFYGKITISDESIAIVAGYTALDCYGVVDLVANSLKDNIKELFDNVDIVIEVGESENLPLPLIFHLRSEMYSSLLGIFLSSTKFSKRERNGLRSL